MQKSAGPLLLIALPVVMIFGFIIPLLFLGGGNEEESPGCVAVTEQPPSAADEVKDVGEASIAGYGSEQLKNAASIVKAGQDLELDSRDITIGIMTAMGESSLKVLDQGDGAGPDSRGLFQQRDNGAWGSYTDRMDPYISAKNFFTALKRIPSRGILEPTQVAHRIQGNANPNHYVKYWDDAVAIYEGVTTGKVTACTPQLAEGVVSDTGWASPANGPITSRFGLRTHPVYGDQRMHRGIDLKAGGCDGPIWAAQSGTVTTAGMDSMNMGTIAIDHGGNVKTVYLHMWQNGILVKKGDTVQAGQQIAKTGTSGPSTGCHLHFEVHVNGGITDPYPFMKDRGVTLG